MRYQFKKGDRVIVRAGHTHGGKAGTVTMYSAGTVMGEYYYVTLDDPAVMTNGHLRSVKVKEEALLPEKPTFEQAQQELCRVLEQMVTLGKQKLALLEEANKWAKLTIELKKDAPETKTDGT